MVMTAIVFSGDTEMILSAVEAGLFDLETMESSRAIFGNFPLKSPWLRGVYVLSKSTRPQPLQIHGFPIVLTGISRVEIVSLTFFGIHLRATLHYREGEKIFDF